MSSKRKTPSKTEEENTKAASPSKSAQNKKQKVEKEDDDDKNNESLLAEIKADLAERKASEIAGMMKDGVLIRLLSTDSFYTALATLRDAKILSAPIYDEKEDKYIGFVDIIDLTAATLEILEANQDFQKNKKKYETKAHKGGKIDDAEEEEDEGSLLSEHLLMETLSVKAISDFSHRDPFVTVQEDDSLLRVAELLRDCHRIAIVDKDGKVTGVATQSGLMELISEEHFDALEESGRKVKHLALPHEVYSVTADDTALKALEVMKEKKVSGLAVVDKNSIVDVVSASDLILWSEWMAGGHVLRFRHFQALESKVRDFLSESRAQKGITVDAPVLCNPKTLLSDALSSMLVNNIHRLIVVDKISNAPVSVLTYGDIITELLKY